MSLTWCAIVRKQPCTQKIAHCWFVVPKAAHLKYHTVQQHTDIFYLTTSKQHQPPAGAEIPMTGRPQKYINIFINFLLLLNLQSPTQSVRVNRRNLSQLSINQSIFLSFGAGNDSRWTGLGGGYSMAVDGWVDSDFCVTQSTTTGWLSPRPPSK